MRIELPSGTSAFIARGEAADRALVIVPDIWGVRELFETMCHDLSARTGWSVATFDPFAGRELPPASDPTSLEARFAAMSDLDDTRLLADAVAAADATGCNAAGLIGFCMGGMYALKASAVGRFDRVVSFYGMARVPDDWQGPGQGEPLDALGERGDCEVMAVIGTEDPWIPADDVRELEDVGVTVLLYEGADHGFVHDPERPAHRADDAADAWDQVLRFLDGLG